MFVHVCAPTPTIQTQADRKGKLYFKFEITVETGFHGGRERKFRISLSPQTWQIHQFYGAFSSSVDGFSLNGLHQN